MTAFLSEAQLGLFNKPPTRFFFFCHSQTSGRSSITENRFKLVKSMFFYCEGVVERRGRNVHRASLSTASLRLRRADELHNGRFPDSTAFGRPPIGILSTNDHCERCRSAFPGGLDLETKGKNDVLKKKKKNQSIAREMNVYERAGNVRGRSHRSPTGLVFLSARASLRGAAVLRVTICFFFYLFSRK